MATMKLQSRYVWPKCFKLSTMGLLCLILSLAPIDNTFAQKCYDITGCCPPDPGAQSVTCTIFGCHSCNGTSRADVTCGPNCPNSDCIPVTLQPCCKPRRAKHKVKRRVRRVVQKAAVVQEALPCCIEPAKRIKPCDKLFEEIIKCKVIFPGDLEENLCAEFKRKLITCEPTTCFAPYAQDPTFRTTWEIHGKNANRCVVSSTFEDIGLRDRKNKPVPVTLTCEYDKIGVVALIKRFNDLDMKYYHFTTCERGVGIHNCSITSNGKPIKKIKLKQ